MNQHFDIGAISPARYFFGIAAILGFVFFFISESPPEQSYLAQLAQWQIQTLVPMCALILVHIGLARLLKTNPWALLALSGLIATLLYSPLALASDIFFQNEVMPTHWITASLEEFVAVAPPIIICWLAINAPWLLGFRLEKKMISATEKISAPHASIDSHSPEIPQSPDTAMPVFYELLPPEIVSAPIYIESELHYISVTTEFGKALILYSLKNAIAELEDAGVEGLWCHRSYWVSTQHVKSFEKAGRNGKLMITGGIEVPVSRANLNWVREKLA